MAKIDEPNFKLKFVYTMCNIIAQYAIQLWWHLYISCENVIYKNGKNKRHSCIYLDAIVALKLYLPYIVTFVN